MSKTWRKSESTHEQVPGKSITIQRTDLSTFDDSFSYLKEKFDAEMKKMDEEMNKFSADLVALYAQSTSAPPAPAPVPRVSTPITWETLASSPLIQGEGDDKMLKLQFDLSQFDPADIKVEIRDDVLTVSASHEEKTNNTVAHREFKREFLLPRGTNPDSVISSLSRDGVLTVQAPLPKLGDAVDKDKVLSKNPQDSKLVKKTSKSGTALPKPADEPKTSPAVDATPQSPLSPVSPAAPTSPTSPRRVSKMSSKTRK